MSTQIFQTRTLLVPSRFAYAWYALQHEAGRDDDTASDHTRYAMRDAMSAARFR